METRCPLKKYNYKHYVKISHKSIDEKHAIITLLRNGTRIETFLLTPRNYWFDKPVNDFYRRSYIFLTKHNSALPKLES